MKCQEMMQKNVVWVSPKTPTREAARLMRDRGIGFLPVCDGEKHVVGIITDRDITTRAVAAGSPLTAPVTDAMTSAVISCRADHDVEHVEDLMATHQVSRIICTDDGGKLAGVITLGDIARREDPTRVGQTVRQVKQVLATA